MMTSSPTVETIRHVLFAFSVDATRLSVSAVAKTDEISDCRDIDLNTQLQAKLTGAFSHVFEFTIFSRRLKNRVCVPLVPSFAVHNEPRLATTAGVAFFTQPT